MFRWFSDYIENCQSLLFAYAGERSHAVAEQRMRSGSDWLAISLARAQRQPRSMAEADWMTDWRKRYAKLSIWEEPHTQKISGAQIWIRCIPIKLVNYVRNSVHRIGWGHQSLSKCIFEKRMTERRWSRKANGGRVPLISAIQFHEWVFALYKRLNACHTVSADSLPLFLPLFQEAAADCGFSLQFSALLCIQSINSLLSRLPCGHEWHTRLPSTDGRHQAHSSRLKTKLDRNF